MSLKIENWLKDLYYEISVFKESGLITSSLVETFQQATPEFLQKKFKTFKTLYPLGNNKDLPILEVLDLIPEKNFAYDRSLYATKLAEKPEVTLIKIPEINTQHMASSASENSGGNASTSSDANASGNRNSSAREGPHLKVSEFLPDTFQGFPSEDAVNHFQKYRDYCTIQNLSDDVAIERFKLTLSLLPRQWIKDRTFGSLDDLEKAFTRQYSKYKSREALIRALSQFKYIPGTSMEKYLADIKELAGRAGQNVEQIRDHFVNGLPDEMRSVLVMHTYADLNELVEKAQKFMELNPKWASPQVSFAVTDSISMTSLAKSIDEIKGELKDLKQRRSRSPYRQFRGRSYGSRPPYRTSYSGNSRFLPPRQNFNRRTPSRNRNRSYSGRGNGRGRGNNRGSFRNRQQSRSPQRNNNFSNPRQQQYGRRSENF